MLSSGFFLVHGFATSASLRVRAALETDTAGLEGPAVWLMSKVAAARAATTSGRLAGLLLGRRDHRGRHRLHHPEVAPGELRRPLHAGAQELALDAGDLVPIDGPGQGLEGLDVVAGLLLHELREGLADLRGTLGGAARHRVLDLERSTGRPLHGLEAAPGRVPGPVDRLARHVGTLVGGALAELGDVVGGLLGVVVPGGLRHDGSPSSVSVEAGGGAALPFEYADGVMLRRSKRVMVPKKNILRPASHKETGIENNSRIELGILATPSFQKLCMLGEESRLLQCRKQMIHRSHLGSSMDRPLRRRRGGRRMEAMTMNMQLVSPAALVAALAGPSGGSDGGRAGMLWRGLRAQVREEISYRRSLRALRRLDDRDLDDLNLGRGDLPGLARRHAREAV